MELTNARGGRESGQALILFALGLVVLLGMAAMTIDVGLAYVERRTLQNAVDSAALAAAQDFVQGASEATATATAIDYLQRHGFSAPEDTIEINIPPTSGQYAGLSGYVEIVASSEAPPAFLLLFLDAPYTLSARSVAEGQAGATLTGTGSGPGSGGGGSPPPLPPANVPNVSCGGPTVDGRVTASDGYTKIGELKGASTDYGDVFYTCDASYLYFGMVLNGPDTGGGVANENVYQCDAGKAGDVQINGNSIKKLKGTITWVGANGFTMDAAGETWTVNVDANTTIELDKQPATIFDLAPGQEADVKGSVVGSNVALATQVKVKTVIGGCGTFSSTYHADYNTGWVQSPKGTHTFKDLWKSDRARFQIACDGVARHDFIQDYLVEDGAGGWDSWAGGGDKGEILIAGPSDSASSLEWNLENPTLTGWGDDPGEDPLIQSPPFSSTYPNYSSEYDGWIWEMIYEFKVPKQPYANCVGPLQFGLHDFSGSAGPLEGIHSSPAKTTEGVWLQIQARVLKLVE